MPHFRTVPYSYPTSTPRSLQSGTAAVLYHSFQTIVGIFTLVWQLVTLPFRLLLIAVRLAGRLAGIAVGFTLMVAGVALWAGPLFIVGIPVFLIGLLLTLRCLG
jgi:hypothetical protein